MRLGCLLSLMLLMANPAVAKKKPPPPPPTVSHVLAWDWGAGATDFRVEQCTNMVQGCTYNQVAQVEGIMRTIELGGLQRTQSYCWRVRVTPAGVVSNVVCAGAL